MNIGADGPRRLGSTFDRLLAHIEAPSVDVLKAVFVQWPEIVGPDVAAHARPSAIDGEVLVVVADDTTWASQLRWLEPQLIEKIREVSGSDRIKSVKLRVAPQGSSPSDW